MSMRVTVIGSGYLGTTHAVGMAELGHEVLAVDVDAAKVEMLARGRAPFYEHGLQEMLGRHTASGRLSFTTSMSEAASFADVHFVCVGTPQRPEGFAADTHELTAAVDTLVPLLHRPALVVGKSTVPVGTASRLAARARSSAPPGVDVEVAWNPEFLREGTAVEDTLHPDRLVFGVRSAEAEKVLREVYAKQLDQGVPLVLTDLATAELVKASANAFLATKVSFINAVAELCEAAGADVVALGEALGYDERIGSHYLRAGLGYGGGCLPKDVRAMMARAGDLGVDRAYALLHEVDRINADQRDRMVAVVLDECSGDVRGRRIGVLGAAFKPGTDDVRDSPALDVAARLRARGAQVRIYDPHARATACAAFPVLTYVDSINEAVTDADVVLHMTEWEEFCSIEPSNLLPLVHRACVVDGRNALDGQRWLAAGWRYRALGRPGLDGHPAPGTGVRPLRDADGR